MTKTKRTTPKNGNEQTPPIPFFTSRRTDDVVEIDSDIVRTGGIWEPGKHVFTVLEPFISTDMNKNK